MSESSKPGDLAETQEGSDVAPDVTNESVQDAHLPPNTRGGEHVSTLDQPGEATESGQRDEDQPSVKETADEVKGDTKEPADTLKDQPSVAETVDDVRDDVQEQNHTPEDQTGVKTTVEDIEEQTDAPEDPAEPVVAQSIPEPEKGRGRSREEIEDEISLHLARSASQLSVDKSEPDSISSRQPTGRDTESELASPDPPAPPPKDGLPKPQSVRSTPPQKPVTEVQREREEQDAIPDNAESGPEIQNIMDQFQHSTGAPGMDEIMSPHLDLSSPVFLPPRTSSLEPQQSYTLSPQNTGRSTGSPTTDKAPSIFGSALNEASSPGRESTRSRPSSISMFQPPPPAPDPEPPLPFDFHRFLEQLRHRTADPVARFLRSFLAEFGKKQWMVHEQVKIISDFLEFISKKMATCEVWRTVSDAEFDNAREGMEKLVMNRLYTQTFSPAIPDAPQSPRKGKLNRQDAASPQNFGRRGQHQEDVERDEVIAQKIRIYGWIREEHLDIKSVGEKGRKFLLLAQQELLKINTYRAPRDKVICVLNACKVIFGFLRNSKSDQSADAFVPLLIYTVLRAHPEHLVSNVQYIWRFRNQEKLGGEAGYYMSSLMGVVTFIENLDRTNLTVSDEEFEQSVEQAVSAIAEGHKADEYEEKSHTGQNAPMQHLSEKSALSRPEVTPRNSMEAERSSPRKNGGSRNSSEKSSYGEEDEPDAVTGLLRTIQKPIASIGRMFSDESSAVQAIAGTGLRSTSSASRPTSAPRGLSPAPKPGSTPKSDKRAQAPALPIRNSSRQRMQADDAAARQASAETAESQQVRAQEHHVVVESVDSPERSLLASVADLIR